MIDVYSDVSRLCLLIPIYSVTSLWFFFDIFSNIFLFISGLPKMYNGLSKSCLFGIVISHASPTGIINDIGLKNGSS